jgi:hypothetical protein
MGILHSAFGYAGVAEQADAHDSKSCGVTRVGSTPTFGTNPVFRPMLLVDCLPVGRQLYQEVCNPGNQFGEGNCQVDH